MAVVEAHITGTVWKIECAVGDAIEEGDTVAILESMKMEMPVESPTAGKVSAILVADLDLDLPDCAGDVRLYVSHAPGQ